MIYRSTLLILASVTLLGHLPTAAKATASPLPSQPVIAQAPDNPTNTNTPVAPLESTDVLTLQLRLQTLGYYNQAVDGIYGDDTVEALKRFQTEAGLPDTGVLDPLTVERLQNPQLIAPTPSSNDSSLAAPDSQTPETNNPDNQTPETSNPDSPSGDAAASTPADGATGSTPTGADPATPASTPSDSTPSANQSANQSEASNSPSEQKSGKLKWLLWLVLAAIGLAGVGGGLIVVTRFSQPSADTDADSDANAKGEPDDPDSGGQTPDTPVNMDSAAASHPELNPPALEPSALEPSALEPSALEPSALELGDTAPASPEPSAAAPPDPDPATNGHKPSPAQTAKNEPSNNKPSNPVTRRLSKLEVVEGLVEDLQQTNPSKRKRAIWELGQRGNSAALQPLVDLLLEADSKERSLILAAISEISVRTLRPMNQALTIALQDPNPDVRKNAIRDITRVYDLTAQAAQVLGQVQTDPDPEVKATAQWALSQLNRIRTISMGEDPAALPSYQSSLPDLLPEDFSQPS